MYKLKLVLLFITFLIISVKGFSSPQAITIQWLPPFENQLEDESTFKALQFPNSVPDENFSPQYFYSLLLPGGTSDFTVTLSNVITEPVKDIGLIRNSNLLSSDFKITSSVSYKKKQALASVLILALRKTSTGQIERLKSFEIEITPTANRSSNRISQVQRVYTNESVLNSGDWFKIGVTQNGVHKLTYKALKDLGLPIDSIDPRNLQLYGNGGGMLPYANYKPRYDDLKQNSIYVEGESDAKFDSTDYILFYGTSQVKWNHNDSLGFYERQVNYYADTTYYFVHVGDVVGKRIYQRANQTNPTNQVTAFDDFYYHEIDQTNFLKSGREWFGESMDDLNNSVTFSAPTPNLISSDTIFIKTAFAGRSTNSTNNYFSIYVNGGILGNVSYPMVGTSAQDNYAALVNFNKVLFASTPSLNFNITMYSSDPSAHGWLNYVECTFRRNLNLAGTTGQLLFRDSKSVSPTNVSEFIVSNAVTNKTIWDITDPINVLKQETNYVSSTISFTLPTNKLLSFVAFDNSTLLTPKLIGRIDNQNLHGLANATLLIVANPSFIQMANDLANFHRQHDNMTVNVVTTSQIYNEFSSGAQDVSAIRDFAKMFYDRALTPSDMPKYLSLIGDASYDNKYRIQNNTNYVVSYQSAGSVNETLTYISDDFFGLLDDNEGDWNSNEIVDISVGRIPIKSIGEANIQMNKIRNYVSGGTPVMANWRNIITFVGDDQDYNIHFRQSDSLANRIRNYYPTFNVEKIYFDAYQQDATPGGQRYPDAKIAINDRVNRGTLLMTYIGHGGELGWAHERVLENSDINSWSNLNHLAAFLTATCEFTRVDDPGRVSAGENVFLNPDGGAIVMFTTSRLAFSSSNYNLCLRFFSHFFEKVNGEYQTVGDIFEKTKSDMYIDPYVRNFLLLGDPAIKLAYPEFNVQTKSINGIPLGAGTDTLKALSKITIAGQVQDNSGNKMTSFNGMIYPTVYDKTATYLTLGNDKNDPRNPSTPQPFLLQKNIVYSGKSSVVNGDFTFSFYVPKDISYQFGRGKLSYYAQNGSIDASGSDTLFTIGGVNPLAAVDNEGPGIKLYMNDDKFVRGGMTNNNPMLYAIITDTSGINKVGTGIGHDLSAELDSKSDKKYILNDYFENDLNSYQKGKLSYPFKNLASGPHTLTLKAWDVFNNSSEATTDFIVSESATLALDHVLNYPNPFTTHTTFMFEHNRPYVTMDVQVQVFTISGKLLKTLATRITPTGYRSDDIQWDGLDDYGDRIGKGIYVYKLRIKTSSGEYADKYEKLVILK